MKILTITLNPAFDVHLSVENFRVGAENYANSRTRQAGGKGVNISRALAANGIENTAFVLLCEDGADEFGRRLNSDGVKFIYGLADGAIRENMTIHSGSSETRISLEGSGITDADVSRLFGRAEEASDDDTVIAFAGRLPQGLDREAILSALRHISASGIKLAVDSNSLSSEDIIKIKPWLIKPNENELSALIGKTLSGIGEISLAAEELCGKGIGNIIASLGAKGAILVGEDGNFFAQPPKINVRSTIGAGDSTLAGFITAKSQGKSGETALACAVAWGSAKCLREGTLPPKPEDIAEILPQIKTEKL